MASGVSGLPLKAECSGWMNKKKAGKGSWQVFHQSNTECERYPARHDPCDS
jgi:hypothetical protein